MPLKLASGQPYDLDLGHGVTVSVRPFGTSVMAEVRRDLAPLGLDPNDPADAEPYGIAFARAAARAAIVDWHGVEMEDDAPAEVTPDAVDQLTEVWPVLEAFIRRYVEPGAEALEEKNG